MVQMITQASIVFKDLSAFMTRIFDHLHACLMFIYIFAMVYFVTLSWELKSAIEIESRMKNTKTCMMYLCMYTTRPSVSVVVDSSKFSGTLSETLSPSTSKSSSMPGKSRVTVTGMSVRPMTRSTLFLAQCQRQCRCHYNGNFTTMAHGIVWIFWFNPGSSIFSP